MDLIARCFPVVLRGEGIGARFLDQQLEDAVDVLSDHEVVQQPDGEVAIEGPVDD